MAERWFSQSQALLKTLGELLSKKGEDRLELFSAMVFAINAIERSLHGWTGWTQNLQLMSKFNEEEMREMKEGLIKEARSFIEYDVKISDKHRDKISPIFANEEGRERRRSGIA